MPENLLGMQISNFRYANMDFFKTPHIQIRFLGKKTVFKYELLVRFSHPCPAVVIQISGGLKMDSEVNLQMPTRTLKRPLGMKG